MPSEVAISIRWNVIFVNCIYLGQATKIPVVAVQEKLSRV